MRQVLVVVKKRTSGLEVLDRILPPPTSTEETLTKPTTAFRHFFNPTFSIPNTEQVGLHNYSYPKY